MASTPNYTKDPKTSTAIISAANANRDGTGTLVTLVTSGTNSSRVERITITATGTTTSGMIRFFIDNGTNIRLWKEVNVLPATPSATVKAFTVELSGLSFILQAGNTIKVSTHNAESFALIAEYGDF